MLSIIEKMLCDWNRAFNSVNENQLDDSFRFIKAGFCFYVERYFNDDKVLSELAKDKIRIQNYDCILFWYPTVYCYRIDRLPITEALQYRIDHLNRSIARLEKEIKSEKI